jgi:hypothetical protein
VHEGVDRPSGPRQRCDGSLQTILVAPSDDAVSALCEQAASDRKPDT